MSEKKGWKLIFTIAILTVSLGGVTLLKIDFPDNKDQVTEAPTPTPSPTEAPTETPTNTPTQTPQNSSQSNSTVKVVEKTIIQREVIEKNGKSLTLTPNNSSNENKDNTSSDPAEKDNNDNDDSENPEAKYKISVDAPGEIVALTDGDVQDGIIRVFNSPNTGTASGQSILSCDSNELINSSTNQNVNYMSVTPGVYIIETNINLENVNFYFVNDIKEMTSPSEKTDDDYEDIAIPTDGEQVIDVSKDEPSRFFRATAGKNFTPVFKFYTADELDPTAEISLAIFDKDNNELQSISINEKNDDDTDDIDGTFSFVQNEDYIIKITSKNIGEISKICYLQISESENSDLPDSTVE